VASTPRDEIRHLALEEELEQRPFAFDFFDVVRRFECFRRDLPRVGYSKRPGEEGLRLGQEAFMHAASSPLASFSVDGGAGRAKLSVYFFGMYGPHGALPLHLTELARRRSRKGDQTHQAFADLFHHRMIEFYYRAWADTEPAVSHDRPQEDRFAGYVAALAGIGLPALRNRDSVADTTKLRLVAALGQQTKTAEGLRKVLEEAMELEVRVEEFVPTWAKFPEGDRWRLGRAPTGSLGRTAVLGSRGRQVQQKFRLVIGPLAARDHDFLLPGSPGLAMLADLVRGYVGEEYAWDLRLILKNLPAFAIGTSARLGWTTRLVGRPRGNNEVSFYLDPASPAFKSEPAA
jgi:type VI secretion system protein ImpH